MNLKIDIDLPAEIRSDTESRWKAFTDACAAAGIRPPDTSGIRYELYRVFAHSDFVAKACIRNPSLFIDLVESGDLLRSYARGRYPEDVSRAVMDAGDESTLRRRLLQIRLREMIRIAWRDLTGHADLSETMADLSDFADACIEKALSRLYGWLCFREGVPVSRQGAEQHLVVIGLGKLGGGELNFSSDIDLVFAYPEAGTTTGGNRSGSNEEFFSTLSRQLIRVLGASASGDFVFRVDMRLRPYGESGPIVMSFDNMIDYYQRQGREWERYAWIKARVVAGDTAAGNRLLGRLTPFVYRRYFDYGAFESLRGMKQKISGEIRGKGMEDNVKLGPGGIREVEFFGQVFQMIRAGVCPVLQERRIRKVIGTLSAEGYIPETVSGELDAAYVFLRNVEHRLQEVSDRQVHLLPADCKERIRLAVSMGYPDWSGFSDALTRHRDRVHFHFNQLLAANETGQPADAIKDRWLDIWSGAAEKDRGRRMLADAGYEEPETVLRLMAHLREDSATRALSREGRARLDRLVPRLLHEISSTREPTKTLDRVLELIKTIQRRTTYLALLLENPEARIHLVNLAGASPWIVSYLTRHPVVLDELLDPRTLYLPPERKALEEELKRRLRLIPQQDLEYQIEALCVFKQVNILRVAAADVTDALPLMRVSDHLSDIAETILDAIFRFTWKTMVEKYGEPRCVLNGKALHKGFAVIAYGKLGGLELGYDSDLDMVFLHAGASADRSPVENTQFFARLGQRMVHILTTHTSAGFLYETDMRLRPSGGSGPLVSHIDAFRDYQLNDAWSWEHQALVRARAVCGNPELVREFKKMRQAVLATVRDPDRLKKDVGKMRDRLRKQLMHQDAGSFDLRQGPGGMVDIEFLVQYLVLLNAHRFPALTEWSDNVRQIHTLAMAGVISDETAHFLKKAYLTYRFALHRLSLQQKSARVPDSQFNELRGFVQRAWEVFLR